MLDMVRPGFIPVKDGILGVTMRDLRLMGREFEIFFVAMFGGLIVMAGRLIVVIGGGAMMFRAGKTGLRIRRLAILSPDIMRA